MALRGVSCVCDVRDEVPSPPLFFSRVSRGRGAVDPSDRLEAIHSFSFLNLCRLFRRGGLACFPGYPKPGISRAVRAESGGEIFCTER